MPHWLLHLGALGVFGVSLVDASPIPLAIPGSTDLLLLLLAAQGGNPWLLAGAAVAGSIIGGYITWGAGKKGGEALLQRSVPKRFLRPVTRFAKSHAIASIFVAALLPPPVPLTPFLLAEGAFGAPWKRFIFALGTARIVRYGLVAWAGATYRRQVVHWWTRHLARWSGVILWSFLALLIAGIALGVWQYRRQKRSSGDESSMQSPLPAAE